MMRRCVWRELNRTRHLSTLTISSEHVCCLCMTLAVRMWGMQVRHVANADEAAAAPDAQDDVVPPPPPPGICMRLNAALGRLQWVMCMCRSCA